MNLIGLDSLWLHVRACGHWTRRVYDLFRVKLQKEHGLSIGETSNIHLRTSMRSRMSRSYINELRGSNGKELDSGNNPNKPDNVTSSSIQSNDILKTKVSSMSLPQVLFHTKLSPASHSVTTLRDHIKFNSTNPSIISAITSCDEKEEMPVPITTTAPTICKPIIKNNHHLTVPASGDYCLRISDASSSTCDDDLQSPQHGHPPMILNDSRTSDVLGYLHMYQNNNRIQFSTIQFNDREDLQVKFIKISFRFRLFNLGFN